MTDEKRTIGETAKLLNVTPATVRNYVNLFGSSHLSEPANRTTSKRFSAEDIETLKRIKHLLGKGSTYDQVLELLPQTPEILTEDTPGTATTGETGTPGQLQPLALFERLQNLLEMQRAQHQETIKAKDEHIETLKAENLRLQAELDHLKKPWYKRLFEK